MTNEHINNHLRRALSTIKAPGDEADIVASGRIEGLSVDSAGVARFALDVSGVSAADAEALLADAKKAGLTASEVTHVSAVATMHRTAPPPKQSTNTAHANPFGVKKDRIEKARESLPDVKHVIAIASGKGGVGKSTLAANLAVALAKSGLSVGLMDADIYGPSLPTLFGLADLEEKPDVKDGLIVPIDVFDLKAMSIGLLVNAEQALAWRGPMVMGAVRQLMNDVAWGPLDVLLIDTPPGTGDAHLTLAQSKRLTGVAIVSTPQEMALADVRRGIELFRKVSVPILGVIENMAWLEGPGGEKQFLFGEGGAERAAQEFDVPFLGAVPLFPEVRIASDQGAPLVSSDPNSPAALIFEALADKLKNAIGE